MLHIWGLILTILLASQLYYLQKHRHPHLNYREPQRKMRKQPLTRKAVRL